MTAPPASTLRKFFNGLARLYRGFRSVILNLIFISLFLLFLGSLLGEPPVVVQRGSALLINPNGTIVDQLTFVEPLDALLADSIGSEQNNEILLQDLLNIIDFAGSDENISAIVLSLNNLQPTGFSKLQELGDALERFQETGKTIYAYGDNYSQGQYYLAAHADEVILNPMGSISLEGFSTYQNYYRDALDKLGINVHIFRVGEYKSAVEPYERNDMSAAAKTANSDWLGDLWQSYLSDVGEARELEPTFINDFINTMDSQLEEFDGDFSQLAANRNLVDSLMSRGQLNNYLKNEIGSNFNGNDFLYIHFESYLTARQEKINALQESGEKIGIIVASGTIYDGQREAGEIGGDTLQQLVRQARQRDDIKGLVLRIDSGGGSAFASEVIRSELVELVNTGKPLVVSMGSVAASGGYWIATAADEIWASETTITGSIGIFGLYPTFENTFSKLGISTDGVGTTELSGAFAVGRELPDLASNVLQQTLEDGYTRFITLVAEARGMTPEEVDQIAQGRVWSGEDALTLGLVDNIGNLEEAIASAAELAQIESYQPVIIEQSLTPGQQLIQNLANNAVIQSAFHKSGVAITPADILGDMTLSLNDELQTLLNFNDPNGVYLQCQECQAVLSP